LVKVYGEAAFSFPAVSTWTSSFKVGESNLENESRSGHPITDAVKSNINLVESLISKNPRISYSNFEQQTSLSRETLNRIIKDKLELTKRSSKWVPMN